MSVNYSAHFIPVQQSNQSTDAGFEIVAKNPLVFVTFFTACDVVR
jgi:hypothetical protein